MMCSGERCTTCGSGYVLFDGRCVGCLWMEECVFNNSVEIECVDDGDLSHCNGGGGGDYVGCSEHVCINWTCKSGEIGENEECMIGGSGCRGCVCMDGWYSNESKDCYSKCGDGRVVGDEECEGGGLGCVEGMCLCDEGYESVGDVSCVGKCGDGVVVSGEECEIGGKGCGNECRCGVGWYVNGGGNISCYSFCGDGLVLGDEECEIGGDGCDETCHCGEGWYSWCLASFLCVCGCGGGWVVGF